MKARSSVLPRPGLCVLAALALGAVPAGSTGAGAAAARSSTERLPSSVPRDTWVTNGPVFAIARSSKTVYVGGNFTRVGPRTGPFVALSPSTGARDPAYPELGGSPDVADIAVDAVVSDGAGGWFLGGNFRWVGGVLCPGLAHLQADKTVDPGWCPSPDGRVRALALSGATLYVGGDFERIGGASRNGIAPLDTSSAKAKPWFTEEEDAFVSVEALAVRGSTANVGGTFERIGGRARRNIAALDAQTGEATPWNPGTNEPRSPDFFDRVEVRAIAVSDGTVYVGGFNLTAVGGKPRVGGTFAAVGGETRNALAALDAATGKATAWNPSVTLTAAGDDAGDVEAIAVAGSTVYLGGYFGGVGGDERGNLAAIDSATGRASAWNPDAGGRVTAIAVAGRTVSVGGSFTTVGARKRTSLAAIDEATGKATAWNPEVRGVIFALAVSGSTVYAGGIFRSVGGWARKNVAALDARTAKVRAWHPGAEGRLEPSVNVLAVAGSTLYIGGQFSLVGGRRRANVAAVDTTTGKVLRWSSGVNGDFPSEVNALALSGSTLYIGGAFSRVGGRPRDNLAAVDAETGEVRAWNPGPDGDVDTIAVARRRVYVGGSFTRVGGRSRAGLAALDVRTAKATRWDARGAEDGPTIAIWAIASAGRLVFLAGGFGGIGGKRLSNVAALDARTGRALPWRPDLRPRSSTQKVVNTLGVSGSARYVGGTFTSIGRVSQSGFAVFPRR